MVENTNEQNCRPYGKLNLANRLIKKVDVLSTKYRHPIIPAVSNNKNVRFQPYKMSVRGIQRGVPSGRGDSQEGDDSSSCAPAAQAIN